MINKVSSYLNLVNNLNNSKSASKKGEKPERSAEFEVEDVVEISSGLTKGSSYKKEIRIEDIQAKTSENLTKEEEKVVEALKERDREVRQHEQAHIAAAGRYAKGVSFKSKIGPDGRSYAVGGEVKIDLSEIPGDPDATIAKAQTIRRAAGAPSHPSKQDRMVSAAASRMEARARMEKIEKEKEKEEEDGNKINPEGEVGNIDSTTEAEDSDRSAEEKNQTSAPAATVYSLNGFETGKLLNKIV